MIEIKTDLRLNVGDLGHGELVFVQRHLSHFQVLQKGQFFGQQQQQRAAAASIASSRTTNTVDILPDEGGQSYSQ